MKVALEHFQQVLWPANFAVGLALLGLLVVRRNYRVYPAFSFYILMELLQGVLLLTAYRHWGFLSSASWRIAWVTEGVTLFAHAAAVAEVCRHLLSRYRGVWALAWRLLVLCGALVLCYSIFAARHDWTLVAPSVARALELSMAAVIVGLLLFARYYDVKGKHADRSVALGLCLLSCFVALNNTVLERFADNYTALWNVLGMFAFLASLSLWTWTLRKPQSEAVFEEILLPADVYQSITPELNLRLRLLNEHLGRFWHAEARRS